MKLKIFFILLVVLSIPLITQSVPTEILKLKTFDYFVEQKEPSGYFTILDITEEDVKAEGGWPIPRDRLAEINQKLFDNGAIGAGWVLSFIDNDRLGGDENLAVSFGKFPIIVATFQSPNGLYPDPTGTVVLGPDTNGYPLSGHISNIDRIKESAFEGIVSAPVDVDNLVRRVPLLYQIPDGWVPSFGTQVLKLLAGADTYIVKTKQRKNR